MSQGRVPLSQTESAKDSGHYQSASVDSLSSWYTILYIICYVLTNHCQVEKILFYG